MQKTYETAVLRANATLVIETRALRELNDDECLVRIRSAGICSSDIARVHGSGAYFYPLVPGHEMAGEIEAVGEDCTHWKLGQHVVIYPLLACRRCERCLEGLLHLCNQYSYYGSREDGGFAQYLIAKASNLIALPPDLPFEKAVLVEPLAVVLHALKRVPESLLENAVISGAGTLGQLAAAVWNFRGKKSLTVVDRNSEKLALLKGPHAQVLKSNQDWGHFSQERTGKYSLFIDFTGDPQILPFALTLLKPRGHLIWAGNPLSGLEFPKQSLDRLLRNELTLTGTWNSLPQTDWPEAVHLLASGLEVDSLISEIIPLRTLPEKLQAMAERKQARTASNSIKVIVRP